MKEINVLVVEAYKTSDGLLYEHKRDAVEHESQLLFYKELNTIIDDYTSEIPFTLSNTEYREFIKCKQSELKEIFKLL